MIEAREQLTEILRQTRLAPRPTADYQVLLEETTKPDENDQHDEVQSDDSDEPVA